MSDTEHREQRCRGYALYIAPIDSIHRPRTWVRVDDHEEPVTVIVRFERDRTRRLPWYKRLLLGQCTVTIREVVDLPIETTYSSILEAIVFCCTNGEQILTADVRGRFRAKRLRNMKTVPSLDVTVLNLNDDL